MVLPVIPHRLTKIRAENRVLLIRAAFLFSVGAALANVFSVCTNEWLHTSEVLKYFVLPNRTGEEEQNPPTYYKNATLGPWLFCWSDPLTLFHCNKIDVFALDDPPWDVTTAVELSIRRCVLFMVVGCGLDSLGLFTMCFCLLRRQPYGSLLYSTVVNILAGLANFACIIFYITSVSKEVGNKIYKASKIDETLFHYSYGFSFLLLKVSFLCTELSALLCVLVFMAKRDERTYNSYRMRSILRTIRTTGGEAQKASPDGHGSPFERHLVENERYHRHARVNTLRRKVSNSSQHSSPLISPGPSLLTNSFLLLAPPHSPSPLSSAGTRRASIESASPKKLSSASNTNVSLLSAFTLARNNCV